MISYNLALAKTNHKFFSMHVIPNGTIMDFASEV